MAQDPMVEQLRAAIAEALPDARIEVGTGAPGHYSLRVVSDAFVGKTLLARQRLVYTAITPLMRGEPAPVHAIDKLETDTP